MWCCCRGKRQHVQPEPRNVVRLAGLRAPTCRIDTFGLTLSGTGTAYANSPLDQTRAYWEVTIQSPGNFEFGVAHKLKEQVSSQLSERPNAWAMKVRSDRYKVNDVIGCSYDMSAVKPVVRFYFNGAVLEEETLTDIKGEVWPAFSVTDPATIKVNFGDSFVYPPPPNFEGVIFSMDMM